MHTVSGISVEALTETAHVALGGYSAETSGLVTFGSVALDLVKGKGYPARGEASFHYGGERIGTAHIIAFEPGSGTGDESTYAIGWLNHVGYPETPQVIPRDNDDRNEVSLALGSHSIGSPDDDPLLFASRLSVLGVLDTQTSGLVDRRIVLKGHIGQTAQDFEDAIRGIRPASPKATTTVGRRTVSTDDGLKVEQIGNPHAIYYNPETDCREPTSPLVQLVAFMAVDSQHVGALNALTPRLSSLPW